MAKFPQRQIHLDFHTPGDVTDVGSSFDPEEFASTMARTHVQSVNLFAKCHHGYSYYPTTAGTVHPGLTFDLLGQQIEALHKVGIRAPIYLAIGWDDLAGQNHPEWIAVRKDGTVLMRPPLSDHSPLQNQVGWSWLDMGTEYADYVNAQVDELCSRYEVDGFWFDIVGDIPNYSAAAQARMRAAGVDISSDREVFAFAATTTAQFMKRTSSNVRSHHPKASIYYNGTTTPTARRTLGTQTHLEVESLPTGNESHWGYLHYPIVARHARGFGRSIVGMTGRFHKSWADFGGLKNHVQLDYEAGTIVGAGGAVSIGDQLDARGKLDSAVYRAIGRSFERLAALEPWLEETETVAEVAIISDLKNPGLQEFAQFSEGVDAAAQLMLEMGVQFAITDVESLNDSSFSVVVLPDGYQPDEEGIVAIERARSSGSKIVLSEGTAWDEERGKFRLSGIPVSIVGSSPTVPSYIRAGDSAPAHTEVDPDFAYVFYGGAQLVKPMKGGRALGELARARYSRTWDHFYSHAQAPVGDMLGHPWGVLSDDVLYLAAPLIGAYRAHDYWVYRALFEYAFAQLLPDRVVQYDGPAWVEVAVRAQRILDEDRSRHVVHLTAYTPRRTAGGVARVDSAGSIAAGTTLIARPPVGATRAYLAPTGEPLDHEVDGASWRIKLPDLGVHSVIVIE
jgi:hypothetical protein